MKVKKIFCLILALVLLCFPSCSLLNEKEEVPTSQEKTDSGGEENSSYAPLLSKKERYQAFLDRIAYPNYQLLDQTTPYFVGRWFEKEIDGVSHMVTVTDGSSCYFMVEDATELNVAFTVITTGATPYFAYSIDGGEPIRQLIDNPTVKLPDGDLHAVCIWADGMTATEGKWERECGFALREISVNIGVMYGIKPKNKVIAYYGDDITQGLKALSNVATSEGNSATAAYPYFCSKVLGAITYSAGYASSGITKAGTFNTFIKSVDNLSAKRLIDDEFCPDVIVINYGTNDSQTEGIAFQIALKQALDRIIEKYPGVPIFYMIPFNQTKAEEITDVCGLYENVTVVETGSWTIFFTDGVHPTLIGARSAGESLASAIRATLGNEFFELTT